MLALGMAVAGRFDGHTFTAVDPTRETFYTELKPISDNVDPAALKASQLDRDELRRDAPAPDQAMQNAADWIRDVSSGSTPIAVCWPLAYDWPFVRWYFHQFCDESPFGFSACLDMKTAFQQKAQVTVARASKRELPPELRPNRRHAHHARLDAIEQAEIWAKLVAWPGLGG
jgi:hypothetical protein